MENLLLQMQRYVLYAMNLHMFWMKQKLSDTSDSKGTTVINDGHILYCKTCKEKISSSASDMSLIVGILILLF